MVTEEAVVVMVVVEVVVEITGLEEEEEEDSADTRLSFESELDYHFDTCQPNGGDIHLWVRCFCCKYLHRNCATGCL